MPAQQIRTREGKGSGRERTSCWHPITRLQYFQGSRTGLATGLRVALDVIFVVDILSEREGAWVSRTNPVTLSIGSASQGCRGGAISQRRDENTWTVRKRSLRFILGYTKGMLMLTEGTDRNRKGLSDAVASIVAVRPLVVCRAMRT